MCSSTAPQVRHCWREKSVGRSARRSVNAKGRRRRATHNLHRAFPLDVTSLLADVADHRSLSSSTERSSFFRLSVEVSRSLGAKREHVHQSTISLGGLPFEREDSQVDHQLHRGTQSHPAPQQTPQPPSELPRLRLPDLLQQEPVVRSRCDWEGRGYP